MKISEKYEMLLWEKDFLWLPEESEIGTELNLEIFNNNIIDSLEVLQRDNLYTWTLVDEHVDDMLYKNNYSVFIRLKKEYRK